MKKSFLFAVLGGMICLADAAGQAFEPNRAKDLSPVKVQTAETHDPIVLSERGKTPAPIVLTMPAEKQKGNLMHAVNQLADCIGEITGTKPAIVKDGKIPEGPAIVIGDSEEAQALPAEGFVVRTSGNKVYISGKDSSHHGIADFLERVLDVRWYFHIREGGRYTPTLDRIVIPPLHYSDYPRFTRREEWPGGYDYAVTVMLRHGCTDSAMACHVPRWNDEYMKTRPEIYQLKSDGTRQAGFLCYGNPKTLETYLERIEEELNGGRKAGMILPGNVVAVSPDDAEVSCCCPDCSKLRRPDLGQYGNASLILENFVIKLANELKKRHPEMKVAYLAYVNYTSSTGQKMPDNVLVQICGMPGQAMYKEKEIEASEYKNLDEWLAATGPGRVRCWQYSCWPEDRTPAPFQYPHVIRKFFADYQGRISGSFVNGVKDHWDRQNLTLACWYRAMWNPDFDVDVMMDEFAKRMFGPAAVPMRKLLGIQCDRWEKVHWEGSQLTLKAIHETSYPAPVAAEMKELIRQAYELAGSDPLIKKRLDFYTKCFAAFFEESERFASGNLIRPLLSQKVGANPKMDGKLDDPEWQRAQPLNFVRAHDKKESKPVYQTEIRSVWTADGVFFGIRMEEPNPELLFTKNTGRDASLIWHGDNIEMLLDPSGKNTGDYYHFIIDAAGGMFDAHKSDTAWNNKGIRCAMATDKGFWSMEIFVPWSEFPGNVPGSGTNTKWTGQFTRLRYGSPEKKAANPQSVGEYTRMNTTYAAFSANLADFAEIRFVE